VVVSGFETPDEQAQRRGFELLYTRAVLVRPARDG